MSFDFLVFDPDDAPATDDGFKEWYEAQLDQPSVYDSTAALRDEFRVFYAEMREMFTPFNGPDNVALPDGASQIRVLRTCEYFFRPHSIYMSFRWAALDMARGTASTFAKALGLGYYHVSAEYGQAVFPNGTKAWPGGRYPGFGAGKTPRK